MSDNELPKALDKSQADIDAAIAAINASEIESRFFFCNMLHTKHRFLHHIQCFIYFTQQ